MKLIEIKSVIRNSLHQITSYLKKLKYPKLKKVFNINSHLTVDERIKIYNIALERKMVICEIGSFVGASACCFGAALYERREGRVICIDTWNNDTMTEGKRDTWREFQNNTVQYNAYIVPIRGFSTDVVHSVAGITHNLDVLFIDGDHSYEGVKADWEAYRGFLKAGAVVIFHDYGWAEGVKRVVHEDVMPFVETYDSLPNMWWGKLSKAP